MFAEEEEDEGRGMNEQAKMIRRRREQQERAMHEEYERELRNYRNIITIVTLMVGMIAERAVRMTLRYGFDWRRVRCYGFVIIIVLVYDLSVLGRYIGIRRVFTNAPIVRKRYRYYAQRWGADFIGFLAIESYIVLVCVIEAFVKRDNRNVGVLYVFVGILLIVIFVFVYKEIGWHRKVNEYINETKVMGVKVYGKIIGCCVEMGRTYPKGYGYKPVVAVRYILRIECEIDGKTCIVWSQAFFDNPESVLVGTDCWVYIWENKFVAGDFIMRTNKSQSCVHLECRHMEIFQNSEHNEQKAFLEIGLRERTFSVESTERYKNLID